MLLAGVMTLHAINTYRESQKVPVDAIDLPHGAARRLVDGRLLMADGSIAKGGAPGPTTLHQVKEVGEGERVLTRAWRNVKDSV